MATAESATSTSGPLGKAMVVAAQANPNAKEA